MKSPLSEHQNPSTRSVGLSSYINTVRASQLQRRAFLRQSTVAAAALTIVPRFVLGGPGRKPPSETVHVAGIGAGGRGYYDLIDASRAGAQIVALCDVDSGRAAQTFQQFEKARRYEDYRRMLEKEEKHIDAVVIATPDHHHLPASIMAMRRGKHVYCEKPLGHNIREVRLATEVARQTGVATQMGNNGHSSPNYRAIVALIKAGVIGQINEVHAWVENEWEKPPRTVAKNGLPFGGRRPKETPPVPKNLNWDLWLGPAPVRPYHPAYVPRSWRGWWDFGNGRLGDMGCHMIDLPFTALELKHPLTIEAEGTQPVSKETAPRWLIAQWTFARPGGGAPIKIVWYDGNQRPALIKDTPPPKSNWPWHVAFVGSKGVLVMGIERFKLYPEERFRDVQRPRIRPLYSHMQDWIEACKTGRPTGCRFDYAGPLAETVLLGTVAFRAGQKIEWDARNLRVTNCPEANRFLQRENREGWRV